MKRVNKKNEKVQKRRKKVEKEGMIRTEDEIENVKDRQKEMKVNKEEKRD